MPRICFPGGASYAADTCCTPGNDPNRVCPVDTQLMASRFAQGRFQFPALRSFPPACHRRVPVRQEITGHLYRHVPLCATMASAASPIPPNPPKRRPNDNSDPNMAADGEEDGWHIDGSEVVISNDPAKIYSEYRHIRAHCPVVHTTQYDGYWLLTRYDDVKRAALDSSSYISSVRAVVPSDPRGLKRPPLNFDAPRHTPFRRALERTVKPSRLRRRLSEPLARHAEQCLAPLLATGHGDISAGFGADFVARVATEWLNLDSEVVAPKLAKAAAAWLNAWRLRDGETVTANSNIMYGIARELLTDRRANPRDPEEDPASSLLAERDEDGKELEEEHLVGCLRQSLVVGVVAPPILIGSICKHLAEDKELQNRLRKDESLLPAAMEEFLRLYTPYRGFARTASHEITLHGQTIRPGEPITLHYTSANRDPDVFEDPDEFIMDRPNIASHMAFGRGTHRCVGMPLARMVIETAMRTILRSTKDFDVDGPLEYSRMPELGIISCPLRFQM